MFQSAFYYMIWIWLPEYIYNKDINPVKNIYLINGINMCISLSCMILSGFGIGYNISLALFGGTAPLFATALLLKYDTWTLGVLLFIYGIISITTNIIWYCIDKKSITSYHESIKSTPDDEVTNELKQ